MAKIELEVSLKKEDGATAAWIVVDNKDIKITNGKGKVLVDSAKAKHTYVVWVEGPANAAVSFDIKQDGFVLTKGKPSVSWGNDVQVEYGEFAHR
jgi:hypothetical protein